MGFKDFCNAGLGLGLGSKDRPENHLPPNHHRQERKKKISLKYDHSFPLLTLGPSYDMYPSAAKINAGKVCGGGSTELRRQASGLSAVSSYSNSSVKRERGEEAEKGRGMFSRTGDEDDEGSTRKKLRLTKEQSIVLENSFREHCTLNPKQKQALAKQLNLKTRQVEVWFQNRRARTKLKQTEADFELLKKCCEALTEENRRLQKEVQELKAIKLSGPLYMQVPAATLTMCPSCERTAAATGDNNTSSKSAFSAAPRPYKFYGSFTHPSATC